MEFLQLTEKRFSARRFTDEAVAQADLDYIMECVRMAPSACNRQPWHFVIVESDDAKPVCADATTANGLPLPHSTSSV